MKTSTELHTCPFCDHAESDIYRTGQICKEPARGTRDFCRCRECAMIYPQPRIDLRETTRYWEAADEISDSYEDPMVLLSRLHALAVLLRRYVKINDIKHSLDIGASSGRLCHFLETIGVESYGLEPQREAVRVGQGKGLKIFRGIFPDQMPPELGSRSYGLITAIEALYYFNNLRKALEKVRSLLSDGGIFFIQCHHGDSPYYSQGNSLFSRYGDYVQCIPTVSSLTSCLHKTGFIVEQCLPVPRSRLERVMLAMGFFQGSVVRGEVSPETIRWSSSADRIIMIAKKRQGKEIC